jgi:DNA-binding MarR family transcriptional regulator
MENRGLIRRHRSGNDSRGAEVELTGEGGRIFRSSSAPHLRLVHQLFIEALTPGELEAPAWSPSPAADVLAPERTLGE